MLSIVLISRNCGLIKVLNLESSRISTEMVLLFEAGQTMGDAPIIFVGRLLRTSGATFPSESSPPLSGGPPRYCPAISANRNCQNGSICAHFD
ncbi:hypothetical protein CEXT_308451 [Caerostris extrusa]|uniref:Uncharacterized protein n=1 Tax=Caerostris extrusa TaxID=172846 RepID=A0AAV4M7B0_CAEEX|nr:hypothetical protein CEXT_308451 [Caerostris extrusa]